MHRGEMETSHGVRKRGALSQDLEQSLRKVYSACKARKCGTHSARGCKQSFLIALVSCMKVNFHTVHSLISRYFDARKNIIQPEQRP